MSNQSMFEYIQVAAVFVAACLTMLILSGLLTLGGIKGVISTFKRQGGKGVFAGIAYVTAFLLLVSAIFVFGARHTSALEISPLNYAEVEAGIVYTKKRSPQCEGGGIDDRATSDIRATLNLLSVATSNRSLRVDVNGEILHHSGAFCVDDRQFDSIGPKVRLRWEF